VAGRRGVEDDQVEGVLAIDHQVDHPVEERHFDQSGRGGGQLDLPVRLFEHAGAEHPLDVALDAGNVAGRFPFAVDFKRRQARQNLTLGRADRALEDVGGGMRRIGRHQQHAAAPLAGGDGERRRAGRLADAPLAAKEHDLPIEQSVQQHGKVPTGECSMPIRRCHS
jgi:hypothetical protein